jgi:non-specific serine/threonine protein kinase
MTTFVGRVRALEGVGQRLRASRVVSIVGPGGAGKSRLAVEFAAGLDDGCSDGVWIAELHTARSEPDIYAAIAGALSLLGVPGRSTRSVVDSHLRDVDALLILDNCEHLGEELSSVIHHLTETCPGLRLLATSRERIRMRGEMVWPLEGLEIPAPSAAPEDRLPDSVELFRQRGQAVDPHFDVDSGTHEAVGEICRRLDGLPLAIELAAARLDVFSPDDIYERLDDIGGFLTSTQRDIDERHSSLQAVMGWSYAQLTPVEQTIFERLGVFSGGFDLARARAVAGFDHADSQFDATFESLLSKSLISRIRSVPEVRYRLLESLRQFAVGLLASKGEHVEMRDRHAAVFLSLATTAEPLLWSLDQGEWLDRLEANHDNLRAALEWLAEQASPDEAQLLAGSLARFWDLRGHYSEGVGWLQSAVDAGEPKDPRITVLVSNGLATLSLLNGDVETSMDACHSALAAADAIGDLAGRAYATQYLGLGWIYARDLSMAREVLNQSLVAAEEARVPMLSGWSGICLAAVELFSGDLEAGREHFLAARSFVLEDGEAEGLGWTHVAEGIERWLSGDLLSSARSLHEAMECFDLLQAGWGVTVAGVVAGRLLCELGEPSQAASVLIVSERLRTAIGAVHLPAVADWCQEGLDMAGADLGDHELTTLARRAEETRPQAMPAIIRSAIDELEARMAPTRHRQPSREMSDSVSLVREGDVWALTFRDDTVRLKHLVGFDHLAALLVSPGRELTAIELGGVGQERRVDTAETIDRQAINDLKARLIDLDTDMSEAESRADLDRLAAARKEFDEITDYLASNLGLGSRSRRFGSAGERARVKVTKAIRSAIAKITEASPDLGLHLSASVSTGSFCVYRPDPSSTIQWTVVPH